MYEIFHAKKYVEVYEIYGIRFESFVECIVDRYNVAYDTGNWISFIWTPIIYGCMNLTLISMKWLMLYLMLTLHTHAHFFSSDLFINILL